LGRDSEGKEGAEVTTATIIILLCIIVLPLSAWGLCELALAMPEKPEWREP
jgi:hypothetical protein